MRQAAQRILLEVCVGSVADVEAAVAAGADRVELCSGLELGGLTPSAGLVETVCSISSVPVVVMLRPRAGGFCYDRHEFVAMLRDAERFLNLGVSGIVFGILDRQRQIDIPRSQELVQCAQSRQAVFHRAFDFISDQASATDALINIRCTRVLTSGGRPTARKGAALIRRLIAHAAGQIEMMPGGGIDADNLAEIVEITGCDQVHVGASIPREDGSLPSTSAIQLCDCRFIQGASYRAVLGDSVAAARRRCES